MNGVYRKKGKTVMRRLTVKKTWRRFFNVSSKKEKRLQKILQKSSQQLT